MTFPMLKAAIQHSPVSPVTPFGKNQAGEVLGNITVSSAPSTEIARLSVPLPLDNVSNETDVDLSKIQDEQSKIQDEQSKIQGELSKIQDELSKIRGGQSDMQTYLEKASEAQTSYALALSIVGLMNLIVLLSTKAGDFYRRMYADRG